LGPQKPNDVSRKNPGRRSSNTEKTMRTMKKTCRCERSGSIKQSGNRLYQEKNRGHTATPLEGRKKKTGFEQREEAWPTLRGKKRYKEDLRQRNKGGRRWGWASEKRKGGCNGVTLTHSLGVRRERKRIDLGDDYKGQPVCP